MPLSSDYEAPIQPLRSCIDWPKNTISSTQCFSSMAIVF